MGAYDKEQVHVVQAKHACLARMAPLRARHV